LIVVAWAAVTLLVIVQPI
jgi:hypothetical protein